MNYYSAKAEHFYTYHKHNNTVPRAKLAGEWGWCNLCMRDDVKAVTSATWQDPDSGERVEIVVCEKHKKHAHIVDARCADDARDHNR